MRGAPRPHNGVAPISWHCSSSTTHYTTAPIMPCYKLTVEYDGTRFLGFQRQTTTPAISALKQPRPSKHRCFEKDGKVKPTSFTVQECLETALLGWTGSTSVQELKLKGAGRTDKGVHALGQTVAIQVPAVLSEKEWELCRATNSRLPDDIAVTGFVLCENDDFDPRLDAKLKQYSYTLRYRRKVLDSEGNVLPLSNGGMHTFRSAHESPCLWKSPWALNDDNIGELCAKLQGTHDFSCFVHKVERRKRDNNMELSRFGVEFIDVSSEEAPTVTIKFILEAKGFRRTMVRNLIGFVVDVCRGKLDASQVDAVLTGTDEAAELVNAAPACGLCLVKVEY